jgi:TRAP-type transport system periplasmic protein
VFNSLASSLCFSNGSIQLSEYDMKPSFRWLAVTASLMAGTAMAQTKWDLAAAYAPSNFHTENLVQFAADVEKATAGKLKITIHSNASLFKAPEIKRSVQGGQAQAGEVLLVNFENENPLFGIDGIPFLASSYAESKKLYEASKKP